MLWLYTFETLHKCHRFPSC